MATEQCQRPIEKTFDEKSHEHLSTDHTQVHKEMVQAETKSATQTHGHNLGHDMTKTHAESKTQSHGVHVQQHAAQGMAVNSHGKKEKKIKEKKEKNEKKEKKEKKSEHKKKPEKEKSKLKKCKDSSSDSD
ncbi:hypothetical protein REPUB_Repub08aG0168800 [Reevesia pubescens]